MLLAALFLSGCAGTKPDNLGVRNGKLAPCPDSPNCVSSQATDPDQRIAPLAWSGEVIADIDRAVSGMPGCRTLTKKENYLYAQCASRVFGFVDDVEFFIDRPTNLIHMRSAARLGYYDFGVNRNRLERMRSRLSGKQG